MGRNGARRRFRWRGRDHPPTLPIIRPSIATSCATLLLCLLPRALAQTQPTTAPAPRSGLFEIRFTERSPLSPIEAQNRRHHIKVTDFQRYTLPDENFEVYVPDDFDASSKYGIFIFVNAGDRAGMPRDWQPILKQRKLIGIGAANSGNNRGIGIRFGLALDGVHNLKRLYPIDETRVYVSGISGGGKVASMLTVIYPEIFRGAIPIVGLSFYRNIPVPGDPTRAYAREFDRPPVAMFNRARQNRFVFITGSEDFNRDSIKAMFEQGYTKDGFQNIEYNEIPGMGHTLPDAEVIGRSIDKLDEPPPAKPARNRQR